MKYTIESGRLTAAWTTIIKCLIWIAAFAAVSLAIMYGFWLILIFMLFQNVPMMWLSVAGELVLVITWWWMIRKLDAC